MVCLMLPPHPDDGLRDLRQCRNTLRYSQAAFAKLLGVGAETYRQWDSGRRRPPKDVLKRALALLDKQPDVPVPLHVLSADFGVHVRTLRAAAADGRLAARYETRSFFGHPVAIATRADVRRFIDGAMGCSPRDLGCKGALIDAPADCAAADHFDS